MPLLVGDKLPSSQVVRMGSNGPEIKEISEICAGKKVVIFAVPGAFTPTCSISHLPGYLAQADAIKAKGVDEIICISANDPFVLKAWGDSHNAAGKVSMIGDNNLNFGKDTGLTFDGSGFGLGIRLLRLAMVVEDNVVSALQVEESPGHFEVSSAESIMKVL